MQKMKNVLTLIIITIFIQDILMAKVEQRIVGGKVANIKDYPHQLCIIIKKSTGATLTSFKGGAAIVSSYWALTAAHCIDFISKSLFKAGVVYLRGNTSVWKAEFYYRDHKIDLAYIHPNYDEGTNDYDLALVKVIEPFNAKYEMPIKVAGKSYKYPKNARVTVTGWGMTHNDLDDPENRLRQVELTLVDYAKCSEIYQYTQDTKFTKRMLCAWEKGKDACIYDSGGPLIHRRVLIGIVSWGMRCASDIYPGVYVNMQEFYDWIKQYERNSKVSLRIRFIT
ncbi:hypothetical protein ILUMI_04175 [Ignelater luminosus]|uniref:Peptidase S1 domain-containing protein n=1 Tax=Ignelater luminosus TaxID=2038154 RepID=A0A8K0GET5_IGNLU|nr:hypothetical protein ILUMI_04175 [Ignelater luminosus]